MGSVLMLFPTPSNYLKRKWLKTTLCHTDAVGNKLKTFILLIYTNLIPCFPPPKRSPTWRWWTSDGFWLYLSDFPLQLMKACLFSWFHSFYMHFKSTIWEGRATNVIKVGQKDYRLQETSKSSSLIHEPQDWTFCAWPLPPLPSPQINTHHQN